MLADGRIDGDKLRVFHTTAPFADYVWVARNNLAPALQEKVAAALIALQPGQDDAVLDILRGQHFVRASDALYAQVSAVARELGLLCPRTRRCLPPLRRASPCPPPPIHRFPPSI